MGRPKALLPWRARTLVETVVTTLRSVVEDVVVVTDERVRFLREKIAMPSSGFRVDQLAELIEAFDLLAGRSRS
jgi:molybdopterin-guanine dinucleotide biosynthesis protein A